MNADGDFDKVVIRLLICHHLLLHSNAGLSYLERTKLSSYSLHNMTYITREYKINENMLHMNLIFKLVCIYAPFFKSTKIAFGILGGQLDL